MSAIYGVINLDDKTDDYGKIDFKSYYSHCCIDRYEEIQGLNYYMGCGIQYFTEEAKFEMLPYSNSKDHVYLTADCVLDNRDELIKELGLKKKSVPDGTIIYSSYMTWKEECVKHLKGMFSFVIYDELKNEVFLAVDQFFSRCFFYRYINHQVYFSTLLKPLLYCCSEIPKRNERWVLDSLTMCSPILISEPCETAYEGIYKLKAGTYLKISLEEQLVEQYYHPEKNLVHQEWSIDECKAQIHKVMEKSSQSAVRTLGNTGVLLSGGLDSTTVAGMMAPLLEKGGKKLYSFTSIPEKNFHKDDDPRKIYNESDRVWLMKKKYNNIEPYFCDSAGKNPINQADYMVEVCELPEKSQINLVWLLDTARQAKEMGCTVLVDGQCGNTTFSYGDVADVFHYYVRKRTYRKAIKEATLVCRRIRVSRKVFAKYYLKIRAIQLKYRVFPFLWNIYRQVYVNQRKAEKYQTSKRLKKGYHNCPFQKLGFDLEKILIEPCQYSQMGEYKTKYSLKYGILIRDFYKNVDVVDLCYKLPIFCYVGNGFERRIMRELIGEIVPDEIRLDQYHRGVQGADNFYRLRQDKENVKQAWLTAIQDQSIRQYLDVKKVMKDYQEIVDDDLGHDNRKMYRLNNIYLLYKFFQYMEKR